MLRIDREYGWGPDGYGKPPAGSWRIKDESLIKIDKMENDHLIAAMKFLINRFGEKVQTEWIIYKRLFKEAKKRNIHERIDWDS